jgi:hypothetical protein
MAFGTLGAMAATLVVAAPSGAATEKVYESETTAECVLAPGVLNEPGTIHIKTKGEGPSTIAKGATFVIHNEQITVTTPAKWGENLFGIGARQARGFVTVSEIESAQATPSPVNVAKPAEFEMGLPFKTPVKNEAVTFTVPFETTFATPPVTVTGAPGTTLITHYSPNPGFTGSGSSFTSTHKGIQSELNGFSEPEPGKFEKVIGPLETSCTEPKASVQSETPIEGEVGGGTTTTTTNAPPTTTTTTAAATTTTTTAAATTTTTTCTSHCGTHIKLNDKLTGFLKVKKLQNQKIVLPEGCTFIGEAEIPGEFEANTACPPFNATFKILGLPATIGLELIEAGPVKGTITPQASGKLLIEGTAKDNIKINSLGLLGLNLPVNCISAEPVVFPLKSEATAGELLTVGTSTTGFTTLPAVKCQGLLGGVVGSLLTLLMSGPGNEYNLGIKP